MRTFILSTLLVLFVSFGIPSGVAFATSCTGDVTKATGTCVVPDSTYSNCALANMDTSTSCPDGSVCCVSQTGGGVGTGTGGTNTGGGTASGGTNTGTTLINPLKSGTSLTSFLNNILDFVINVGSIIVILMLVFVGFKFVVAQGKDAALVEARKMLLWTIIGALVLLGARAISAGILATVQSLGG